MEMLADQIRSWRLWLAGQDDRTLIRHRGDVRLASRGRGALDAPGRRRAAMEADGIEHRTSVRIEYLDEVGSKLTD